MDVQQSSHNSRVRFGTNTIHPIKKDKNKGSDHYKAYITYKRLAQIYFTHGFLHPTQLKKLISTAQMTNILEKPERNSYLLILENFKTTNISIARLIAKIHHNQTKNAAYLT